MEIYSPSAEELAQFRRVAQAPVIEMVRRQIGDEWINKLLKA